MKIVSVADTHEFQKDLKVPDGDVFIHCGDFSLNGSIEALLDFRDWLNILPHAYKIVIAGNHDRYRGTTLQKTLTNTIYLENSSVEIMGVKFWGSPYTPSFSNMRSGLSWYRTPGKQMGKIWKMIPEDVNVLITHGPPNGILDETVRRDHAGDGMLASTLHRLRELTLHMFGHIHEGYGILKVGKRHYVNCSVVNEDYNMINKPTIIEFDNVKEFKRGNMKVYQ